MVLLAGRVQNFVIDPSAGSALRAIQINRQPCSAHIPEPLCGAAIRETGIALSLIPLELHAS